LITKLPLIIWDGFFFHIYRKRKKRREIFEWLVDVSCVEGTT
jgi:hypothetical protein